MRGKQPIRHNDLFANTKRGNLMDYISVKEAAKKWDITVRWVQQCCSKGLIPGTGRLGNIWLIPVNAIKPNPTITSGLQPTQCLPLLNRSFLPGVWDTSQVPSRFLFF